MKPESIQTILVLFNTIIIPFAVNWLSSVKWTGFQKFILCVALSILGSIITLAVSGNVNWTDFWNVLPFIFSGAVAFYRTAFQGLGLDKVLFPKRALADKAQEQVAEQIAPLSNEKARAILNPEDPTSKSIQVTV